MKILIPALRSVLTTTGISSRGGSTIPTSPTSVNPLEPCFITSASKRLELGSDLMSWGIIILRARSITRLPEADQSFLILSITANVLLSRS